MSVPPKEVFAYFRDSEKWTAWQGTEAEIELFPDGDGTLIRLTHSGLPPELIEVHRFGWEHYVSRLAAISEGHDPGPNNAVSG